VHRIVPFLLVALSACGVAFTSSDSPGASGGTGGGTGGGTAASGSSASSGATGTGGTAGGGSAAGGGGNALACDDPTVTGEYLVHRLDGAIDIDGACDDPLWMRTTVVPWGAENNGSNNGFVECRFLWQDGAPDSFLGCCTVGDADIEVDIATVDGDDIWNDDGLEFFLTSHLQKQWVATSIKTFVSPNDNYRDADWSDVAAGLGIDVSYDGNLDIVSSVDGSLNGSGDDVSYTIEWRQDLGFDGAPESLIGCAFRMNDNDMNDAIDSDWQAFGETLHINDPTGLHVCKLSCAPPP
jgi:hypothetical protein